MDTSNGHRVGWGSIRIRRPVVIYRAEHDFTAKGCGHTIAGGKLYTRAQSESGARIIVAYCARCCPISFIDKKGTAVEDNGLEYAMPTSGGSAMEKFNNDAAKAAADLQQAIEHFIEHLQPMITDVLEAVRTLWRAIRPTVALWVAQCDELTTEEWNQQSYRTFVVYLRLKELLAYEDTLEQPNGAE